MQGEMKVIFYMSLRGGRTKQSHAIQGGYASMRLPRYRNDN
jgi:hypothetical protein